MRHGRLRRAASGQPGHRLSRQRQDHAAQPAAARAAARPDRGAGQRVRRGRARSSAAGEDRRRDGAAAERLRVLHHPRRSGRGDPVAVQPARAGHHSALRSPGDRDHRAGRPGADRLDAARRAGAPASLPPRQRDRHGRCGERRAPARRISRIGQAGRDRRSHRADQDRSRRGRTGGASESRTEPPESDRADPRCRERPARARRADGERRLRSRAQERRGAALAGRGGPRSDGWRAASPRPEPARSRHPCLLPDLPRAAGLDRRSASG